MCEIFKTIIYLKFCYIIFFANIRFEVFYNKRVIKLISSLNNHPKLAYYFENSLISDFYLYTYNCLYLFLNMKKYVN